MRFIPNETQKIFIDTSFVEEWKKQILIKASLIRGNIMDWSVWYRDGRAFVGRKRIEIGYTRFWYLVNREHTELSAIKILHRKVRAWLNKRK